MNPHKFLQEYGFCRHSKCSKFYEIDLNEHTYTIEFITNKSFEIKKRGINAYWRHRWLGNHRIDSEDIKCFLKRYEKLNDVYNYIQSKSRCLAIDNILKTLD